MIETDARLLHIIFDTLPSGLLLLDARRRILRINAKAQDILGLSVDSKSPFAGPKEECPAYLHPLFEIFRNNRHDVHRGEINLPLPIRKEASTLGYNLKSIITTDKEPCKLFVFSDITQVTQDRMTMDKLKDELHQSRKMASIGTLVAGVAHEMNNPLTGVSMSATLIRMNLKRLQERLQKSLSETNAPSDDPASILESIEKALKEVNKILHASEKGSVLIRDLLLYSRPEHMALTPMPFHDIVLETVNAIRSHPEFSHMTFTVEGDTSQWVACNRVKLEQVFYNLLKNAAEAIKGPGVARIFYTERSDEGGHGFIEAHVKDNGPGIDQSIINRIFDPFFTTKNHGGVGLGLSISYRTVEQHGGTLSVRSKPGEGAEHIVSLPVHIPTPDDVAKARTLQGIGDSTE